MDRETIQRRLHRILARDFARDEDLLTPEATFRGTLMMDSLDLVDLVFFIQREFGVEARMEEYREVRSLEALVSFIEDRAMRAA